MDRIRCRIWNCSLCDKCKPHDKVSRTGFSLFFCKFLLKEKCCQCNCTRRRHSSNHNSRHNIIISRCDCRCTEYIRRFIKRATHVNRHHTAKNQSQNYLACASHACKSIIQCRIDAAHYRLYYEGHQKPHNQNTNQRINEYRRDFFQEIRQLITNLAKKENCIACHKTSYQRSQKTRFTISCNHPAYKAKRQRRSVSDCHRNKSCQHRKHESECNTAQVLEPCRDWRTKVYSFCYIQRVHIHTESVNQECNRNQNTSSDYERKHMGHSIHKLCINLMSHTAALFCRLSHGLCS